MPDPALDRLIAAHLDDALAPADAAELHRRLRAEPEARALLLAAAAQASALPLLAGRSAPVRPRWWPWAAAAGLLAAVGAAWLALAPSPVLRVDGGAWLRDGGIARAAESPLVLAWSGEATRLVLAPGGELRVEHDRGRKELHLLRGELRADVAHQPAGSGLAITTPHGRVEVVGTRFDVAVEEGRSRVSVDQGTVRVGNAGAPATVAVEAGFDVRLDGARPPVPSPRMQLPAAAPVIGDGRSVTITPADWLADAGVGWEGGLGEGNAWIASVDIDERVARVRPPFRREGWTGYGDDLVCSITVEVDRPTTLGVVLVLDRGDGRGWLGNLQDEQKLPAGTSTVAIPVRRMRRVHGFEVEAGPRANVTTIAIMSWIPRTELRVSRIAFEHRR